MQALGARQSEFSLLTQIAKLQAHDAVSATITSCIASAPGSRIFTALRRADIAVRRNKAVSLRIIARPRWQGLYRFAWQHCPQEFHGTRVGGVVCQIGLLQRIVDVVIELTPGFSTFPLGIAVAFGPDASATVDLREGRLGPCPVLRIRQIDAARDRLASYTPALEAFAHQRGEALSVDHLRLTEAAGGGATVKVSPVLPADIIGLYVLLPEVN